MVSLLNVLRSQRSLLVVITATVAGAAYPALADPLGPLIPVLVAGLIFTAFYGIDVGDVGARNLSVPVLASLACLYVVVPLALYPVAAAVLSGEVLLGVLVVLSAPLAAGSSIIWTRLSGGNTLLATVIVLLSLLLAPVVMPAIVTTVAGSTVEISAAELVVELAAIILVAGVLSYLVPDGAVSDGRLDDFSVATMGVLIYAGVGGAAGSFDPVHLVLVGAIAVAALGISVALAYALYVQGARIDDCIGVLFSSSMKNLSVSVMVGAALGGGAIIASITAFHVVQQVVSSSLVHRLESATTATSSEPVAAEQLGD